MDAWKHSQYFFRQPLFLQLQPLLCRGAGAALEPSSTPPCRPRRGRRRVSNSAASSPVRRAHAGPHHPRQPSAAPRRPRVQPGHSHAGTRQARLSSLPPLHASSPPLMLE